MAQRAPRGVARREERGRHAHAVRPAQRHVGDGAGAPGRRRRDPPAPGRRGVPAAGRARGPRRRRLPRRARRLSRAAPRRATPSGATSTSTACAAPARSTSPGRAGASDPPCSCPTILGNVRNFEPGAGKRRFEQGRQEASEKEQELLERLRALPDGEQKADETKRMIDRVRTFAGYREYPKYGMVCRYFVYKQALLREAERLVRAGVLREHDDIFFLRFDEFARGRAHEAGGRRAHPRAEGGVPVVPGAHAAPGAHLGRRGHHRSVSARRRSRPARSPGWRSRPGTVEGRARVILDMAQADLEAGDILVTAYTDPSWTPLFVGVAGAGDGGGRPDDARRGDRAGVRPARRRGGGERHPADPGRAADPRARHRRATSSSCPAELTRTAVPRSAACRRPGDWPPARCPRRRRRGRPAHAGLRPRGRPRRRRRRPR